MPITCHQARPMMADIALLAGMIFNQELENSIRHIQERHPHMNKAKLIEEGEKLAKRITLIRLRRMGITLTEEELDEALAWYVLGSG